MKLHVTLLKFNLLDSTLKFGLRLICDLLAITLKRAYKEWELHKISKNLNIPHKTQYIKTWTLNIRAETFYSFVSKSFALRRKKSISFFLQMASAIVSAKASKAIFPSQRSFKIIFELPQAIC